MPLEVSSSLESNGNLFDADTARPTEDFANLLKAIGIDIDISPPCLLDKLRVPFSFNKNSEEDPLDLMFECGISTMGCYNPNKAIERIRSEVERWCHHRTAEGVKNHKAKEKIIN
ncbi:hypothetical protein HN512_03785 [Candidatus Peregrinibacteria bacterium]|jgi:hypothetical protein|nr:hypothetical protein [Candidatus Peregrinibacteria bacterium]MBT3598933.1 hypothetical protein [Candidatus Peregrinibacteria bacterium]MBT4367179.1 hypothetical protein [Candidatus Peregrinibacteria bacterium]MBT4586021.1 hypothetical protein [Candidatus Peregrinibacteria bacterium]MBT6730620.1 hypothetical protein [Candidatus Peregrinibacteria bacterium]